jgi:hypothetical protein
MPIIRCSPGFVRRAGQTFAIVAACTSIAAPPAHAQRRGRRSEPHEPDVHNVPYDGRFTFARIRYQTAPDGYYYRGLPAWAHGYSEAELNLMKILNEVSLLRPHMNESNVFALDDPELCRYPVAYMTEAGYWTMTDREATAFRAYLLKGGLVIFDDFRDSRGHDDWQNFERQMTRVIPGARFVDLTPESPVFHSFFDVKSLDVPQYYDQGTPVFRGLFENNDPTKRLLAIINFNTDVSNFWEFSAEGFVPIELSNEAYKLGVDYVMYGMMH